MWKHVQQFWSDKRILLLAACCLLYGITMFATQGRLLTWLMLLFGMIAFFPVEYIVHRFVLHGLLGKVMPKAHEGHEKHHDHPTEIAYLLTPNFYNIVNHAGLLLLCLLVFRNWNLASAIMLGLGGMQLYYEWVHFVSHRPIVPRTPWGKWMKKQHLLHHYKSAEGWFGVTNPTLDVLLGTNRDPSAPAARSSSSNKDDAVQG